jgi:DNA anti-recombination protein RmuC
MALTTEQMETNLTLANNAYAKAVNSLQYTIGNRSKSNQRIRDLREEIRFWSGEIAKTNRGGISVRGITTN